MPLRKRGNITQKFFHQVNKAKLTMSDLLTPAEKETALAHDLTGRILRHLDRHLIYPLVDLLDSLYGPSTLNELAFNLLKDTYMFDFLKEKHAVLYPGKPFPEDFEKKEAHVKQITEQLDKETKETLHILSQKSVQDHLKQDKEYNTTYLAQNHGITEAKINALYDYAQVQYNLGNNVMALDLLNNFRVLSTNVDKIVSATWGKLACEILTMQWDAASQELEKLREVVDQKNVRDPEAQATQRVWLAHWALFVFFNAPNGLEQLCDLFFSLLYLATIQAKCPWLVRYMVAAVVGLAGSRKKLGLSFNKRLRELVRVVEQEQYEYRDPLTDLIKALYIDFDFEAAREQLERAKAVIKADFFLSISSVGAAGFVENARHLISEVYCRVHSRIELKAFSSYLGLLQEDGEKWIAKLIKDSKLYAKIDEGKGVVVMEYGQGGVYQDVIEGTKGLIRVANLV